VDTLKLERERPSRGRPWQALLLAVLITGGCGDPGAGQSADSREAIVRERAQAWADALLAGDLDVAFSYTSPVYRQFSRPGAYHARVGGAGNWRAAEVEQVTCSEEYCTVIVMIDYYIPQMDIENTRPLEYRWVEHEGQWWLYVPAK
jgi:hypothetical protein